MAWKPTDKELALWRRVTAEATPMDRRGLRNAPEPEPPASADAKQEPKPKEAAKAAKPASKRLAARMPDTDQRPPVKTPAALHGHRHGRAPGIDRRTALRLKRGQMAIEGRIDLHGMRQEEAHRALNGFIATSRAAGRRCILVITGKGAPRGSREAGEGRDGLSDDHRPFGAPPAPGILRRQVPRWLSEGGNREAVLAFATAQPQHGGGGALYVLLRRRRDMPGAAGSAGDGWL